MSKICKHCRKIFSDSSGNKFSSHVRWCDMNPNRTNSIYSTKNGSKLYIDSTYGNVQTYIKYCKKCGIEFTVQCRESQLNNARKVKQYCSRSCANSRNHSDDTKTRISNKLIGSYKGIPVEPIAKITCICGKVFTPNRRGGIYCSRICAARQSVKLAHSAFMKDVNINPEKYSLIQKNAYRTGKQKIGGGTTKWISYNGIKVQGTYEYRTCIIFDKMKSHNMIYNWEYTRDRYRYMTSDGKYHNYLIDFKVFNLDGSFYYIEVKGYIRENDYLKWESVRSNGHRLDVWFIKDIIEHERMFDI